MAISSSVTVEGMSCDHCVRAVESEIAAVPGVTGVDVDLGTGRVRITSDRELGAAVLRDAVEAAGYQLAG